MPIRRQFLLRLNSAPCGQCSNTFPTTSVESAYLSSTPTAERLRNTHRSTNGSINVGRYVESVRRAGGTPVVVCRTDDPAGLDAVVSGLDLLVLTGGEDVAPARYGERPSPRLGRVNAVRDAYDWALLSAAVRHGVPVFGTCPGAPRRGPLAGGRRGGDPAVNTAIACYRSLRERGLMASRGGADGRRRVEAFISVGMAGPLADAVKYGRETGSRDIGTRIVPMAADNMPSGSAALIKTMMSASAAALAL